MSFPFRLIFLSYGGSALLAWLSWATGGTALGAGLVFWACGTVGMFALPVLMPSLRRRALITEAEEAAEARAREAALDRWEADLAAERTERELARWDADLAAEQEAAAAARGEGSRQTG
ncbi:MAG: hypothetical protein D6754_06935 [Alphaproteobacteria bacterium]|nr:MAG: hypothetical protein D6754_06935 [Alphaproteobacteria bacterium]